MITKNRSCGTKVRYQSKRQATARASAMRRYKYARVHAYKCDFCGHWHVGHPTKKKHR